MKKKERSHLTFVFKIIRQSAMLIVDLMNYEIDGLEE